MSDTTPPLTLAEEAAIRERCEKATPGPWLAYQSIVRVRCNRKDIRGMKGAPVLLRAGQGIDLKLPDKDIFANVAFAAHARTDIPRLLAELDRLRAENARLTASLPAHPPGDAG